MTAVHCETPSGVLNPLGEVGTSAAADALYYVDFVASAGGAVVDVDACHIDLGLLGSQKVLSLMPDLSMISVSERMAAVTETGYAGYDALAPWRTALADKYFPTSYILAGAGRVAGVAAHAIGRRAGKRLRPARRRQPTAGRGSHAMNVRLFPVSDDISSPTVTAAYVPDGWTWQALDQALRSHGMAVGGNYGKLAGKVFRGAHGQPGRHEVGRAWNGCVGAGASVGAWRQSVGTPMVAGHLQGAGGWLRHTELG